MLAKFFSDRPFYKNVATLVVGTGIGQIILFFFTAILTRLYAPSVFGSLSVFLTWATFLAVVATLRYELAIPIPKTAEEAYALLSLAFIINGVFSLALLILFLLLPEELLLKAGDAEFTRWMIFIPLSVFLIAAYQVMNYWIIRNKNYRILSVCRIAESTTIGLVAVLLSNLSTRGLLTGYIAGQTIIVLIPVLVYFRQLKKDSLILSWQLIRTVAKKYSHFPRINILQTFSDLFQFLGIILIGSMFYPAEVIGFYSLCIRVLQAPMTLLVKPIANVYYAEASSLMKENKSLKSLTVKTAMNAAMIGVPVVIIFLSAGPWIFSLVFGNEWSTSGMFARVLVPWIFMDFIRSPISQLALLIGKQKQLLYFSLSGNLVLIIALFTGHYFNYDFLGMLTFVSVSQTIFTIFLVRWIIQQNNNEVLSNG
jgi:lipopolysaccharide exporter